MVTETEKNDSGLILEGHGGLSLYDRDATGFLLDSSRQVSVLQPINRRSQDPEPELELERKMETEWEGDGYGTALESISRRMPSSTRAHLLTKDSWEREVSHS